MVCGVPLVTVTAGPVSGAAAAFVRLKRAGVPTPIAEADTLYAPAVPFAVNVAEVAIPEALVTAVVTPPANVPLAPPPGAANVTVTPLSGLDPESFTMTTSGAPNAALTAAVWADPLITATVAGPPLTGALTVTFADISAMFAPLAWMTVVPPESPVTGTFMLLTPALMNTVDGTVATPGFEELTFSRYAGGRSGPGDEQIELLLGRACNCEAGRREG